MADIQDIQERVEVLVGPTTFDQVEFEQAIGPNAQVGGITIKKWNHPTATQPTEAQLQAVTAEQIQALRDKKAASTSLNGSDVKMARVGEDVIDALVAKGTIAMTDLPSSVQTLLNERKAARNKLK